MSTLVIYHGLCFDGFTAAWVCRKKFGEQATYYAAQHHQPPPDVTGKDVVMVDFCYKFDVMVKVVMDSNSVLILDHHKSAQEDLKGLAEATHTDKVNIVFDMDRSGTGIAWDHFFPDQERLWLINYVEDKDLGNYKLPRSKEVNAYIKAVKHNFTDWDTLALFPDHNVVADKGKTLMRYVDRYVDEMKQHATLIEFEGYTIPSVNAPYFNISELVGALADNDCSVCKGGGVLIRASDLPRQSPGENCNNCHGLGHTLFALGWFQRGDGLYQYSLRSRGTFDVSVLVVKYGGGGHQNAAGFSVVERIK